MKDRYPQTHRHTHAHTQNYTEVTQRLTGVVSVRIKRRRVIYACQVSVATTVHEWPRIKGTRILTDLPFTDRALYDSEMKGETRTTEVETTRTRGKGINKVQRLSLSV